MATHASAASTPGWIRWAALIAILWNAFGVAMYLDSVGVFGDPLEGLSEAERALATTLPTWVTAAFATGTFAGLLGSLGLLLRRRWARPVLLVSLAALLLLEGWIVFLSGAVKLFGLAVPITVVIGAVLLAWLAGRADRSGWLR